MRLGLGLSLPTKSKNRPLSLIATPTVLSDLTNDAGLWMDDMSIITASQAADDASAYSVYVTPMPSSAETGRIYIAVEVTANTTFNNDVCIGAVQIASNNGTTLDQSFRMNEDGNTWQYASANTVGNDTISEISGYLWQNIANTTTAGRFNRRSSTGSASTGAQGGLLMAETYNIYDKNSVSDGNNDAILAQTNIMNYIYSETSSQSANSVIWTRSPEFTLDDPNTGAKLVVAYHACTPGGGTGMVNTSDEHLMTLFWVES